MDDNRLHLAAILVHLASAFGLVTNSVAVITIKKCVNLHTSFGILCASLAACNSLIVVMNSIWYLMPDYGLFTNASMASRVVGVFALVFWIGGIRIHLFISINRLISIVFPFTNQKYITVKRTSISIVIALILVFIECAPFVFVHETWFCFNRKTMQWRFAPSEFSKFYEANVIYLDNLVEFGSILVIDVVTLIHLRMAHTNNAFTNSSSAATRAIEIRLFKQAFSQSIPLLATFLCFAFLTPVLSDDFGKFVSTTLLWHLAHGVDGLIIDIFHTRLHLFIKKSNATSVTASSFALSSVAPSTMIPK